MDEHPNNPQASTGGTGVPLDDPHAQDIARATAPSDAAAEPALPTDPAQQSLADALRVSFGLLKFAMLAVLVLYLLSGIFIVDEQERAVRLRFGELVGDEVYGPGVHLGLPYPIEDVVTIPVTNRTLTNREAFFFSMEDVEEGRTFDEIAASGRSGPLNPEQDGSLLTGDANIVHVAYEVNWRVDEANIPAYLRNVGEEDRAQAMIRAAVEAAVVRVAAATPADDVIAGEMSRAAVREMAQARLDRLNTGVALQDVLLNNPTMPLSVREAYNAVINAESQRSSQINTAQQEAQVTLRDAGGEAAASRAEAVGPLIRMIREHQRLAPLARVEPEAQEQLDELNRQLDRTFDDLTLEADDEVYEVGGEAANIIQGARTYASQLNQRLSAEVRRFNDLLPEYRRDPAVFRDRYRQDAVREILGSSNVEVFRTPDGELRLLLDRNPELERRRERERLEREQEQVRR
jgi:membrane protease subunit HflK